jgi:hypothetical protein
MGDRVPRHSRSKVSFRNEKEKNYWIASKELHNSGFTFSIYLEDFFKTRQKYLSFLLIKKKRVCPVIYQKTGQKSV